MQKTILVVDDELLIREQLSALFEKYGFNCRQAGNSKEAKEILQQKKIDLATVDVVMPGESGIELTKWIKLTTSTPVIMVTSLDDNIDTVVGLEVGADDYIAKPFDPRVLLARVNAVLRRFSFEAPEEGSTVAIVLDLNERCLKSSRGKISLNAREVDFLKLLAEANGQSVSRESLSNALFNKAWNPMDRSIDNFVARLRQKIEVNPSIPQYIATVRQIGYMIPEGLITID